MDLRLVSYFLKVYESGSISAAARELHLTQPTLSRQIRKLERNLGVKLFTTGPKAVATSAANTFVPIARDLLNRAEQAEKIIKSSTKETTASLTIAGAPTTVADIIAPFIASSGAEGVLSNIREVLPTAVYHQLSEYRADLVVGSSPPPANLNYIVIGRAPIWAQLPESRKNSKRTQIDLHEVCTFPIAIVDDNFNVRRIFDQAVSEEGLSVQIAYETQSTQASQALAAANRAVCISSDDPRFGLHPLLIVKNESAMPISITLYCAWDPGHFATKQIKQVAEALRKYYEAHRSFESV